MWPLEKLELGTRHLRYLPAPYPPSSHAPQYAEIHPAGAAEAPMPPPMALTSKSRLPRLPSGSPALPWDGCANLSVGLRGKEAEQVSRHRSLFDLPRRRPSRHPDPRKTGERAGLLEREPCRWPSTVRLGFRLRKRGERHHAAILRPEPAAPMRGFGVSDVRHTGIGLLALKRELRATACPTAPLLALCHLGRCGRSARHSRGRCRASGRGCR